MFNYKKKEKRKPRPKHAANSASQDPVFNKAEKVSPRTTLKCSKLSELGRAKLLALWQALGTGHTLSLRQALGTGHTVSIQCVSPQLGRHADVRDATLKRPAAQQRSAQDWCVLSAGERPPPS